jgi:GNAT superfamily N-acetyltransferase
MKITYTNEVLDAYSGQVNCEAGIYVDDEIVGVAQYVLYDGELSVSNIFIRPEFRRKGFGSRLIKYIKQENSKNKYKPSMKTDDGAAFTHKDLPLTESLKDVLIGKTPEEAWSLLSPQIKEFYKKLKKAFPKSKLVWPGPYFKVFVGKYVYYISYSGVFPGKRQETHWNNGDKFGIYMRSGANLAYMGDVNDFKGFIKFLEKHGERVKEIKDYDDFVKNRNKMDEGIGDILKPKSKKELDDAYEKIEANELYKYALQNGLFRELKLAVEKGADLNSEPALWYAVSRNNYDMVKYLFDLGLKLENKEGTGKHDTMIYAVLSRDMKMLRLILDNGGEPTDGLEFAAGHGITDMLRVLLDEGADVHHRGEEALQSAASSGQYDAVKLLLERGADPNNCRWSGVQTILM